MLAESGPVVASGSPRILPSELFREKPTTTGRPSVGDLVEAADQLEVLLHGLAEPDPGVDADPVLADPGVDGELHSFLEEAP